MAVTPWSDKYAIQAILRTDPYLTEELGFDPKEMYLVRATDDLLFGDGIDKNKLKKQIFIYNTQPESTINPLIHGIVYEVDVSAPTDNNGTVDLAIEQILALLRWVEVSNTHRLEILETPTILSSENSLYQVGVRFVIYETIINQVRTVTPKPEPPEEETPDNTSI